MKITPRNAWVLVRPLTKESNLNKHGLVIPDQVEREQKAYGEIVEVGSLVKDLEKGQRCIFGKYAGETLQFAEKEEYRDVTDMLLILADDILALIEK